MLVIASDGFMYKETTLEVEAFLKLMEEITRQKEEAASCDNSSEPPPEKEDGKDDSRY